MPNVFENILVHINVFMQKYGVTLKHVVKRVSAVLVIALLLEVCVFNFNYFASSGLNTICLNDKLTLQQTSDEKYKITEVNHTLEFSNLNTDVRNIWLNFDWDQPAQLLKIKIQFTDGAHSTYFDTTEYTVGVPTVPVSTMSNQSKYINLSTTGLVNSLKIEVLAEDDTAYPIKLDGVYINVQHPFDFNMLRFAGVAFILGLIYVFRPKSSIYKVFIVEKPRKSKAVIVAAVAIEVVLMSAFLFYGSNLVGISTANYNAGEYRGGIVNTYDFGDESSQQYAELAKSMASGKLYLEAEPPQWLKDMDDPYDKGSRDELQKETGEKYLYDVAYHDGHYYVYFGVVPVIMFYLPFYLATGAAFPTAIGVLIAAILFVLGCSALLDRFARYHFRHVSLGLYLLLQIALVGCCGMLYLLKFPTFYSLPIMLGLAFSVWGIYFWMKGRTSDAPCKWYLLGSLCMALVVGCRPQLVVLSFLAFPLFWRSFITKRHLFTKQGAREFACLLAPYAVVVLALVAYNYARFGAFLDFGANYNLTLNDMTKRGFSAGRIAPAFFAYFLQPPFVTGVFPYLHPAPFETTYMGQTIREVTFGGILACLPMLWVLPFAPRILRMRYSQRSTRTIAGVILVLLTAGVVVALVDAQAAGILQRYYADFSFMFLIAMVLLVFIVNENLDPASTTKNLLMKVLIVLVAISLLYSSLLCLVPETNWYGDVYNWAYQDIVEMFQFWS